MPCNSRISQTVHEGKFNIEVLTAAARAMGYDVGMSGDMLVIHDIKLGQGWQVSYRRDGRLVASDLFGYTSPAEMIAKVKRAYSAQAVRTAARRCGWNVTSRLANQNKLMMTRG